MVFTPQGYRTIRDEATGKAIIALHLFEARDGTIWVGTFGQGLLAIRNNRVIHRFDLAKGLLSPTVNCLLQAGNTLWVGTGRGVHRLNLQTLKLEALSQADGIDLVEVKAMVLRGRWLWAATPKGMFRIPANQDYQNHTRPLLYLTGILVNDQRVPLLGSLQLGPLNKNLKLELTGLALRSRGNFTIHYRLLGADTNWNEVPGLQASVSFLSLPAGSYTFQAYAKNEDGVISAAPLQLAFIIQPPFYAEPWFIVLSGLLLAGVVALITRYRIRLVERRERLRRERAELEQELRISRLSAIKAQMNPHFIFNALNSIQSFFLANDRNAANEYLGKFANLMRKTLQMSAETSVTLDEEIEALTLYMELEQARFQDTLSYTITVDEQLDTASIRVPSLFIQPYVENAYKHGLLHKKADRKLEVAFRTNAEHTHLLVSISDNGVGRAYTQALRKNAVSTHRSFATSANQKRIELLNSNRPGSVTILYEDHMSPEGQALGTTVILKLHLQWMQANGKDNHADSR
jgi:two-component sensor histidine kinase